MSLTIHRGPAPGSKRIEDLKPGAVFYARDFFSPLMRMRDPGWQTSGVIVIWAVNLMTGDVSHFEPDTIVRPDDGLCLAERSRIRGLDD